MSAPEQLAKLDYLAEVAKDWAISSFAAAGSCDFVITPHRFDLDGCSVRRHVRIPGLRPCLGPVCAGR